MGKYGTSIENLLLYDLNGKNISLSTNLHGTITNNVFGTPHEINEKTRLLWAVVNNYKIFQQKNKMSFYYQQLIFQNCNTNSLICAFNVKMDTIKFFEVSPNKKYFAVANNINLKVFQFNWDIINNWNNIENKNKIPCTQICHEIYNRYIYMKMKIEYLKFYSENQLVLLKGTKVFTMTIGYLINNTIKSFESYNTIIIKEKQLTHDHFEVKNVFYNSYEKILFVAAFNGVLIMYRIQNEAMLKKKDELTIRKLLIKSEQ